MAACPLNFKEPDLKGSMCCIADHIQTPYETTCADLENLAKSTSNPLQAYCPAGYRLLKEGENEEITCCVSTNIPDNASIDCQDAASVQKVLYIDKAPWSASLKASLETAGGPPFSNLCNFVFSNDYPYGPFCEYDQCELGTAICTSGEGSWSQGPNGRDRKFTTSWGVPITSVEQGVNEGVFATIGNSNPVFVKDNWKVTGILI